MRWLSRKKCFCANLATEIDPWNSHKKWDVVVPICNSSTLTERWKERPENLLGLSGQLVWSTSQLAWNMSQLVLEYKPPNLEYKLANLEYEPANLEYEPASLEYEPACGV